MLMTAGLPETSPPAHPESAHARTVTVPMYVPGAIAGGFGMIVTTPLAWPVMENVALKTPVMEEIPTKPVPPLIDTATSCDCGVGPLSSPVNCTFVVDRESEVR